MILLKFFKKFPYYRELRYIYRSFFVYKKPFSYLYYRFIVRPKIRKLNNPIDRPAADDFYSIHILCSHSDIDMLLWALASWYQVVPDSGQVYIHEDGSFTAKDKEIISKLLSNAIFIDFLEANEKARTDWLKNLSKTKVYREKAVKDRRYILAVKLIDPYFVSESPIHLIIDTDILWFEYPKEILELLKQKRGNFVMTGNSLMDFKFKDNTHLPENLAIVNSGIVGYKVDNYFLSGLEEFCEKIDTETNPQYFTEQAGYSYILNKGGIINMLNKENYIIKGELKKGVSAKHYTGPRREQYWFEGVRILKNKIL